MFNFDHIRIVSEGERKLKIQLTYWEVEGEDEKKLEISIRMSREKRAV